MDPSSPSTQPVSSPLPPHAAGLAGHLSPSVQSSARAEAVARAQLPPDVAGVAGELGPEVPEISGVEAALGGPQTSGVVISRRFGGHFHQDITSVPARTMSKVEELFKKVKVLLIQNNAYGGNHSSGSVSEHEIAQYKISIDLEKKILRYHEDGNTEVKVVDLTTIFADRNHAIYGHLNELEKSIGAHTTRGGHDIEAPFPSVSHKGGVHALKSDGLGRISMEDYVNEHLSKIAPSPRLPAILRISKMHTYYEKLVDFFKQEIERLQTQIQTKKSRNEDFSKEEAMLQKLQARYADIQEADLYALQTLLARSDEPIKLPHDTDSGTSGIFVADRTDVLDRLDMLAERVQKDLTDVARVGKSRIPFTSRDLTPDEIAYTKSVALLAAPSRLAHCNYMDKHGLAANRHMFVERALLDAVDKKDTEAADFKALIEDLDEITEVDLRLRAAAEEARDHVMKRAAAIGTASQHLPFPAPQADPYKSAMKAHRVTKEPKPLADCERAVHAALDASQTGGAPTSPLPAGSTPGASLGSPSVTPPSSLSSGREEVPSQTPP